MKQGRASFLSTNSAATVFETVKELYVAEGFVLRNVAPKLGVHFRTLYKWLREHPDYSKQLEAMRAEHFKEQVDGKDV